MTEQEKFDAMLSEMPEELKGEMVIPSYQYANSTVSLDIATKKDAELLKQVFNQSNITQSVQQSVNTLKSEMGILLQQEFEEMRSSLNVTNKKQYTPEDVQSIYGVSKKRQGTYRGRLKDPMPYIQYVEKGNIYYDVKKLDHWCENNGITRGNKRK